MVRYELALPGEVSDSESEEELGSAEEDQGNTDQDDPDNGNITFDKSLPGAHAVSFCRKRYRGDPNIDFQHYKHTVNQFDECSL